MHAASHARTHTEAVWLLCRRPFACTPLVSAQHCATDELLPVLCLLHSCSMLQPLCPPFASGTQHSLAGISSMLRLSLTPAPLNICTTLRQP